MNQPSETTIVEMVNGLQYQAKQFGKVMYFDELEKLLQIHNYDYDKASQAVVFQAVQTNTFPVYDEDVFIYFCDRIETDHNRVVDLQEAYDWVTSFHGDLEKAVAAYKNYLDGIE